MDNIAGALKYLSDIEFVCLQSNGILIIVFLSIHHYFEAFIPIYRLAEIYYKKNQPISFEHERVNLLPNSGRAVLDHPQLLSKCCSSLVVLGKQQANQPITCEYM